MTALLLVLTGLLIALNGFFVMGEYALVRSRRTRLEAMRDEGMRGATLALHEIDEIGDYISTVQVGITMTSIGIGALGEPVLADLFEPWFGNVVGHGLAVAASVTIAYLIITSAHIVAGELVPKLYAIDRAEGVARVGGLGVDDVLAVARLNRDDAHAVRHDVVQFPGDAQALLRDRLAGRLVLQPERVPAALAHGVAGEPGDDHEQRGGDQPAVRVGITPGQVE